MATATPQTRSRSWLEFAALFLIAYLLSQFIMRQFFPSSNTTAVTGIELTAVSHSIRNGNVPELNFRNATAEAVTLPARCPQPPVDVLQVAEPGTPGERLTPLTATGTAVACPADLVVPAGGHAKIDLKPWKYALFSSNATYEFRLPDGMEVTGTGATVARVEVYEPGAFVKLFRTFITRPFLNFLVAMAAILPGHNLGFAIVLLTIAVKLILFLPTQHSLESQRRMQAIQPKIDALRKKHDKDPQALQAEMVKLWKEHKVNPFSSCLPLLIQFPILIGLFYVVRDGSSLELSRELLYPFFRHIEWSFGTFFLGFDLTQTTWILAPVLAGLQFWQMWLTFQKQKKNKKPDVIDAKTGKPEGGSPEAMQQKVMLYAMPLMIGFFSLQFPTAVSVYWGVSTLFGVAQQVIVNRRTDA